MEENQNQSPQPEIKTASNPLGMLVIIGAVVLLALSGFLFFSRSRNPTPQEVMENNPSPTGTSVSDSIEKSLVDSYTLAEIAQHAVKDDCWFTIENKVYKVTEYIAGGKHPGKDAIIQGCGKDATELFNTRPMGSGTRHSDKAWGFLANFQIGVLAE